MARWCPSARTGCRWRHATPGRRPGCPAGRVGEHGLHVVDVDVRSHQIEVRRPCLPDVDHPPDGSTARIVPRLRLTWLRTEPRVRVHRQWRDRLALRGEGPDVRREPPGHEDLVGLPVVAEDLGPGPRSRVPADAQCGQFRPQLVPVGIQMVEKGVRHGRPPRGFGDGRPVATVDQHPHLVLDLDDDDDVDRVDGREMAHECDESAPVGGEQLEAEDGEHRLGHGAGIVNAAFFTPSNSARGSARRRCAPSRARTSTRRS